MLILKKLRKNLKTKKKLLYLSLLLIFIAASYFWITFKFGPKNQIDYNQCQNINERFKKTQCEEFLMDQVLQKQGLDQAFSLMDNFFNKDEAFGQNCHDFAHKLGQSAYLVFASGKAFSLSPKSSYCGYGFYHGFMEALIQKTNDMNQAREFCRTAGEKLKESTSDAEGACYHGIGHGVVDGSDPRAYGNAQAIIDPGLRLCEGVANSPDKLYRCITGVFNAFEILSSTSKSGLSLNLQDPMWICKKQIEKYREGCYAQLVVAVIHVAGSDFKKGTEFIEVLPEDKYAFPAMESLIVERVHSGYTDYSEAVGFCKTLQPRFNNICITSVGEAFLKYGPPSNEYKMAIDFCNRAPLSEIERKACFDRILPILRVWYSAEKSEQICKTVDPRFQINRCQYN